MEKKDNPTVEQLKKELRIAEILNRVKKQYKEVKR